MALPILILLGSPRQRGEQLERLTAKLLQTIGYRYVQTRHIGSGGEEIDVVAERELSILVGSNVERAICECKAHAEPMGMTQWLKFLGKIFVEEATQTSRVSGFFISLSGVNGNVLGNYQGLRSVRQDIRLVTGEDLVREISRSFEVVTIIDAEAALKKVTDRPYLSMPLAYHNERVYRIVMFEDRSYSIIDYRGVFLRLVEAAELIDLIDPAVGVENFIDLHDEARATERRQRLRKSILCQLINSGGSQSVSAVAARHSEYSPEEFSVALVALENDLLVSTSQNDVVRIPTRRTKNFVERIARVYLTILTGTLEQTEVLGCEFYDRYIDPDLLQYCLHLQGDLSLSEAEQKDAIALLRMSPSALANALNPQPFLKVHREDPNSRSDERTERNDRTYFMSMLHNCLSKDYNAGGGFTKYFIERRGLIEMETRAEIKLKSKTGVEFEGKISERIGHGQMDENSGGHYVTIWIFDDTPEPWELASAWQSESD